MIEILIAIVVAAIAAFALFSAFAGASTGVKGQKKVKPQQQQQKKKDKKPTKKELQAKAREEAEIERLIAKEAVSVKGMPSDKAKVVSLEEVNNKGQKQEIKKGGNRATASISTKQRLIDAEQGFNFVEKKVSTKSASPPAAGHDEQRDRDRDLTRFFRSQDKKGKDKKEFKPRKEGEKPVESGKVTMKKKITANPKDLWGARQWEATE